MFRVARVEGVFKDYLLIDLFKVLTAFLYATSGLSNIVSILSTSICEVSLLYLSKNLSLLKLGFSDLKKFDTLNK